MDNDTTILPLEQWLPSYIFPDTYEVSNLARVRCIKTKHVLKHHMNKCGYSAVNMRENDTHKIIKVHRLVAFAYLGDPPEGNNEVNHKNGIKSDNRPENLEWSNRSLNMKHAYATGLKKQKFCESSTSSKLTWALVRQIRSDLELGASGRNLSKLYNVARSTIRKIKRNESWKE